MVKETSKAVENDGDIVVSGGTDDQIWSRTDFLKTKSSISELG